MKEQEQLNKKRQTLLRRFDIPIEQLDYKYVGTCKDGKKLEKILRILRSGEEGYFPDLENFVKQKLEVVDPSSRLLRVEIPIMRPESLESDQRRELESDLLQWIQSTSEPTEEENHPMTGRIFDSGDDPHYVPVRATSVITKTDACNGGSDGDVPFLKPSNPNRIKSWEYDKWSQFDVDAELTRLDIQDMKAEDDRIKTSNEAKRNHPIKTDQEPSSSQLSRQGSSIAPKKPPRPSSSLSSTPGNTRKADEREPELIPSCRLGRSFIEELPTEFKKTQSKRRTKIIIDDVNTGMI